MPLYKSAQVLNVEDLSQELGSDEVILYEEKPSDDDVIELHRPEEDTLEIMLKLPSIPGSTVQEIEVFDEPDQVEEKPAKTSKKDTNNLEVKDPRDWRSWGPARASEWAKYMFDNIPRHSGETTGIERNISYLEKMDRDLSKMIAEDYEGKVDIVKFEQVRHEIRSGIHRLEEAKDRLDNMYKRKKKADGDDAELVKEAKQTAINGIIITVPIFISRLASTLINGMVSGGKNIEREYDNLSKEWKLTAREQVELMELLYHMGYAQPLRDRGLPRDGAIDYSSSDNPELNANFPS
jgi:hypothetical protein